MKDIDDILIGILEICVILGIYFEILSIGGFLIE